MTDAQAKQFTMMHCTTGEFRVPRYGMLRTIAYVQVLQDRAILWYKKAAHYVFGVSKTVPWSVWVTIKGDTCEATQAKALNQL